MDKKDRVTIKINGQPKTYVEKKDEPIQMENDEAAAVESPDESFDWILPNEMIPSSMPKKVNIHHKKTFPIHLKVPIILAIAAVVVGTSLGLIVIRTITTEHTVSEPVEPNTQQVVAPVKEPSTENRTVQAFLVQGGIFSTEESAQAVQAQVRDKNIPAEVFKVDNNYYIFLGAAETLDATKELALRYKTSNIAVYWKEINFTTKLANGDQEGEKLVSAYTSLAELSAAQLRQTDSTVDVNQIKAQLNQLKSQEYKKVLSEAADFIQNGKPSKAQDKLLTFLQMIVE